MSDFEDYDDEEGAEEPDLDDDEDGEDDEEVVRKTKHFRPAIQSIGNDGVIPS